MTSVEPGPVSTSTATANASQATNRTAATEPLSDPHEQQVTGGSSFSNRLGADAYSGGNLSVPPPTTSPLGAGATSAFADAMSALMASVEVKTPSTPAPLTLSAAQAHRALENTDGDAALRQEVDALRSVVQNLVNGLGNTNRDLANLNSTLTTIRTDMSIVRAEMSVTKAQADQTVTQLPGLTNQVSRLEANLANLPTSHLEPLHARLRGAEGRIETLRHTVGEKVGGVQTVLRGFAGVLQQSAALAENPV